MMTRNSLRQLCRTPVRTILFVLLLALASMLSSLGGSLWMLGSRNLERFEKAFTTIGTVEQRKSSVEQVRQWDAGRQDYMYFQIPRYDAPIPVSVLDFEEAEYILEPEKRPCYEAYLPDYHIWDEKERVDDHLVVEVSPDEDCVPDHPVRLNIHKVHSSGPYFQGDWISFCDHYNEKPEPLYADRTYMMCLLGTHGHDLVSTEYIPSLSTGGVGFTKDGKRIESQTPNVSVEEITENFFEEGGRWENWEQLILLLKNLNHTVPVTPTHSTGLLMAFYRGDAYLCEGEDITEEQYEAGKRVCLIGKEFAEDNGLHVGDRIPLRLCTANYRYSAGIGIENLSLNPEGKAYTVFSDHEYEITGIYALLPGGSSEYGDGYQMGHCEIIVPWNSIEESDENHITAYGPMMGYTTSFQIPNGTIDTYMEAWNRQNVDGLTITFYDKGYSQLKDGLDRIRALGMALLTAGAVTVLLILFFFSHLFISRQNRRTAIERSLGMEKRQCRYSMLCGMLLIAFLGSVSGSLFGYGITEKAAEQIGEEKYYDTAYSSSFLHVDMGEDAGADYEVPGAWTVFLNIGGIVLAAYVIADKEVKKNLQCEPLRLLGERME